MSVIQKKIHVFIRKWLYLSACMIARFIHQGVKQTYLIKYIYQSLTINGILNYKLVYFSSMKDDSIWLKTHNILSFVK